MSEVIETLMFVKPSDGLRVRFPEKPTEHLSADGATVPRNTYWLRRLKAGDVVKAKAPTKKTTPSTKSTGE